MLVFIACTGIGQGDADRKRIVGVEHDVIFLEADFADPICGAETFNAMWRAAVPKLIENEFLRARALKREHKELALAIYAVGDVVSQISSRGDSDWRAMTFDSDWRDGMEMYRAEVRSAHRKRIGSSEGRLYNVLGSVRMFVDAPKAFFPESTGVTRVIYVGDMLHYDGFDQVDPQKGQFHLFNDFFRRKFAEDVAAGSVAHVSLDPIAPPGVAFRVYGINVPRCKSMPLPAGDADRDFSRSYGEIWRAWERLFTKLGADVAVLGLEDASGIR